MGTLLLLHFQKKKKYGEKMGFSLFCFLLLPLIFFLNSQFYPVLTQYQGGLKMAQYFEKINFQPKIYSCRKIMKFGLFDFYTQQNTPRKRRFSFEKGDRVLVYENDLQNITQTYKILHQGNAF